MNKALDAIHAAAKGGRQESQEVLGGYDEWWEEKGTPSSLKARIELLTTFKATLLGWEQRKNRLSDESTLYASSGGSPDSDEELERLRTAINRNLYAARQAVIDSGVFGTFQATYLGQATELDPFRNIFNHVAGQPMISRTCDMIERAIGVYEQMAAKTGLVPVVADTGPFDVETAIRRSLRVAFRNGPPQNEKQVQDAIEVILASVGVEFTREQETAPVGPRAFRPDFALTSMKLAVEVKLTNGKHSASDAQEEISADISAFGTKWSRLLVLIYDVGVIHDPERMRDDNMKHFGVSILIVKH